MSDDSADITVAMVPKVSKGFRLQFEKAQDAWVLLYPEGMVKLNQSAGEILQRCDGERRIDQVVTSLEQAFDQTGLTDDVLAFMNIAREQNWITLD